MRKIIVILCLSVFICSCQKDPEFKPNDGQDQIKELLDLISVENYDETLNQLKEFSSYVTDDEFGRLEMQGWLQLFIEDATQEEKTNIVELVHIIRSAQDRGEWIDGSHVISEEGITLIYPAFYSWESPTSLSSIKNGSILYMDTTSNSNLIRGYYSIAVLALGEQEQVSSVSIAESEKFYFKTKVGEEINDTLVSIMKYWSTENSKVNLFNAAAVDFLEERAKDQQRVRYVLSAFPAFEYYADTERVQVDHLLGATLGTFGVTSSVSLTSKDEDILRAVAEKYVEGTLPENVFLLGSIK